MTTMRALALQFIPGMTTSKWRYYLIIPTVYPVTNIALTVPIQTNGILTILDHARLRPLLLQRHQLTRRTIPMPPSLEISLV